MQRQMDTTTVTTIEQIYQPGAAWLNDALADIVARQPGYVYLLHLAEPIGQRQSAAARAAHGLPPRQKQNYRPTARHYLGWCKDLAARMQAHQQGNGSRFMAAAKRSGVDFQVVRVWVGDRAWERQLKGRKNAPRLCPICNSPIQRSIFELTPAQIEYELIGF
ncbi:MAG: hypothetical protein R6X32_05925 [Chloroflexota bacterium]